MEFYYDNGVETSNINGVKLEHTGKNPQNGTIIINANGDVALAIHDGKYCAEKTFMDKEISISTKKLSECTISSVEFAIKFGGSDSDFFDSVKETSDGYIAVGMGSSSDGDLTGLIQQYSEYSTNYATIAKYDFNGNKVWGYFYGGSNSDEFMGITKVSDGYIIYGYTYSEDFFGDYYVNCYTSDAFIIKTDDRIKIELPPVGKSKVDENYCDEEIQ